MRAPAHLLSAALHPLFMPLITMAVAFRLDPHLSFFLPEPLRLFTYGMVALLTIVFPLTSTYLLLRSGFISSLSMPQRGERIVPYGMTLFYFGLCLHLLRRTPQHEATLAMLAGAMLALLFTLLITLRWKISAHMVGAGGLLGTLSALMLLHRTFAPLELALFIVLAGALGTARLLGSDHTMGQVAAGTALGFACTFGSVLFAIG